MDRDKPIVEEVSWKTCGGCIYYRAFTRGCNSLHACHYLYDTDEVRGCPISACDKKKLKRRRRKKND